MVPNTKFLKESLQSTPWYRRRHVSYKRKCALNSICTLSHTFAHIYITKTIKAIGYITKLRVYYHYSVFFKLMLGKSTYRYQKNHFIYYTAHTLTCTQHIILTCMRMQVRSIIFKKISLIGQKGKNGTRWQSKVI